MFRYWFLVILLCSPTRARVDVHILPFSKVRADRNIRLIDVSVIENKNNEKIEEIENTEILPARGDGEKIFISRTEFARIIESKFVQADVRFRIPNQMILEAKSQFLSEVEIERQISKEAANRCQCFVYINELKLPKLENEKKVVDWKLDLSQIDLKGSIIAPIKLEFAEDAKVLWLTAKLELKKEALVARRQIRQNEKIQNTDLEKKIVDITYIKGKLAQDFDLIDSSVSRFINSGQTVLTDDLKRDPAARRGQIVKVIAGTSEMEISTQAVAEETGFVGELIKVKNLESQKILSVRVIDKAIVRLE